MSYCLMVKKGNMAVIGGVECDFVRIKVAQIQDYKKDGWSVSVDELKEPQEEQKPEVDLQAIFEEAPERLTKDELVELGAEYGLKLTKRNKEAKLIEKIKEAM